MNINENSLCDIVSDLLPLYADDSCTEESKQLIEQHIKACPDCADTLKAMKQPVNIEAIPEPELRAVKKATRKLKIRTALILIIAAAVAFMPITSAVHWFKGDGICFSNINDIKQGNAIMEMWKTDGFEKVLDTMVPADMYNEVCTKNHHYTKNPEEYVKKEIQGRAYYTYQIFEDKYIYGTEEYMQNFWYNIITDTLGYYIIPADIYENLEKEYGEDFYKARNSAIDNSVPKKITTQFGDFYFNYNEEHDEYIYNKYYKTVDFRDKVADVYELEALDYIIERADILTPELYDYYSKIYNDTIKWDNEYTDYYKNMGLDGFTMQWRSNLLEFMADYKDIKLTDYKLTDIYQATGSKDWNMIFSVEFSNGASGNIYIITNNGEYAFGGAFPNESESEKSRYFFYGFDYTAKENYLCSAPYQELFANYSK